ncbi:hypothetical protein CBS101457_001148 [Exobasidium rhododendri]|nr:hypothetical protein CBS101457_001148 [Exobasidium rhododendri]
MPTSTFARKTSNAQGTRLDSSSSSAATSTSTSQVQPAMPLMSATTNTTSNHINMNANGSSLAGSPAYFAAATNGGSSLSEFGSGGGIAIGSGSVDRAREDSSRATSPFFSPTLGGGNSTFPSGSNEANQGLSQSFPASAVDAQSLHSATHSTFAASLSSTFAPSSVNAGQHTEMSLKDTFSRRIRCLAYVKRCLSIVSNPPTPQSMNTANAPAWLDVIKLSKRDLEVIYDSEKMKRRTNRNHTLGCSIAPALDYSNSAEFARALLAIFNEVEVLGEGGDKDKAKVRNFFKTSSMRGTRRGMAGIEWDGSAGNTGTVSGMSNADLLGSQVVS